MLFVSRKKLPLTVAIAALAMLALGAWSPWVPLRYHGDGKFSDRGLFSYPRYLVTFSDIQLSQTGEYHFHFRGLPSEEMTLMLYVKNVRVDTRADSAPLTNLQVNIEALLTDEKGILPVVPRVVPLHPTERKTGYSPSAGRRLTGITDVILFKFIRVAPTIS